MRTLKILLMLTILSTVGLAIWRHQSPQQFSEKTAPVLAYLEKVGLNKKSADVSSSLSSTANTLAEQPHAEAIQDELQALTDRGKTAVSEAQKVLGKAIEVDENSDKAAHEKALEYGTYLYCKQVVDAWEKTNQKN